MIEPVALAECRRDRIAGIDLVRRTGTKVAFPLVLLHGIGSNAASFGALMDALSSDRVVVAWNAPGYGHSERLPADAPTPEDYAAALARLLDALDMPRVALLGHSLGCLFAARFAARHPERVAALALISPALGYAVAPGAALPASVQGRIDELQTLGPERFAESRAPRLVGDPDARPDVVAAVRRGMAAVDPQGYAQAVRALGAGDLCSDIARVRAPSLVAVGTADRVTPPANARTAHAAFASGLAAYREVEGAGHALPQEQPEALAALLSSLLERATDD
jgi:pimeloyl-ACP methyl ester carboxylesterase